MSPFDLTNLAALKAWLGLPPAPGPNEQLFRAIVLRDVAEVRHALELGAKVNVPDSEGVTPLMRAAGDGAEGCGCAP